jgi:hypothetical protein
MLRRILTVAIGVLLVGNAVALAALPSGARHLTGVIPDGDEVLVSQTVGHVRVMVLSHGRRLRLLVAYRQHKRWHSVRVEPAKAGSQASFATTDGAGPVPAFSAVYGMSTAASAVVKWHDTKSTAATPVNGAYLVVRRGRVKADGVEFTQAPSP